jgi:hypothetical protein
MLDAMKRHFEDLLVRAALVAWFTSPVVPLPRGGESTQMYSTYKIPQRGFQG